MAITINRCICGCSLRTGVLIWLWLSMILVLTLIKFEVEYVIKGPKYLFLYWFHVFQLSLVIGWAIVNTVSLLAIHQNKPKSLVTFLWFSVLSIMLFVAGLILLAIFWTDIVNSKFASEYIQEMIIAEESRLSSAERSQLYEKIKEIIKQFGLLAIVALGAFLLVLEIYVTIATYSLYFKMNEPPPRHDYPPEEPEIISVETKKRRSQLRPHSFLEVKPIMKIN